MMSGNMIMGLAVMLACLTVQALLVAISLLYYRRSMRLRESTSFLGTVGLLGMVMSLLVIGNLLQISIWALLFTWLNEFQDIQTAVYHSAVNFATLGYGDIVMSEDRRILGPLEAINGVLMVGVSTAVIMATLQDILRRNYGVKADDGQ